MKKLFLYLLNKYSQTEEQRREIHKVLHEKVSNTYSEQTVYGQLYNNFLEFLLANPIFTQRVINKEDESLAMIKNGMSNTFENAKFFTKFEITKAKLEREKKMLDRIHKRIGYIPQHKR